MPLGAVLEAVVPVLALRRFIPRLGQAMVRCGFSDRGDGRDRENAGEDRRYEFRGSDHHLQSLRLRDATLRLVQIRQNNWAAMGHNSGPEMALFGLAPWPVARRPEPVSARIGHGRIFWTRDFKSNGHRLGNLGLCGDAALFVSRSS